MKVKRPSEPYCRESTTCNRAVSESPHLYSNFAKCKLVSYELCPPPRALVKVALPCLQDPSPPHACPGRGSRVGRPPSVYPTFGCGSSLWNRQSCHNPPSPSGSHTPRLPGRQAGGTARPVTVRRPQSAAASGEPDGGLGTTQGPIHPRPA